MLRSYFSTSEIIFIVLIFGAPVIEPQGKIALNISKSVVPFFKSASICDVIWCRVLWVSISKSFETFTVPVWAIFPKSFRNKSTIITFSARFFSSLLRNSINFLSSSIVCPLLIVPFIGLVKIWLLFNVKNSSGEKDKTVSYSFFR